VCAEENAGRKNGVWDGQGVKGTMWKEKSDDDY